MRWEAFKQQIQAVPYFTKASLVGLNNIEEASQQLQLTRWTARGLVWRLKRNLYTLPDSDRRVQFSGRWLANTLYSPSYLSLEFALSWYDMIPERVYEFTSVSLQKTACFKNNLGTFRYHHIKDECFFGFHEVVDEFGKMVMMAHPEKALLDFVYFRKDWQSTRDYLQKNLRLQGIAKLNKRRLKEYSRRFDSKKITAAAKIILTEMDGAS